MERRGGKRAGAGRKTSTIKRDRALFIRCTAEERQEIKLQSLFTWIFYLFSLFARYLDS